MVSVASRPKHLGYSRRGASKHLVDRDFVLQERTLVFVDGVSLYFRGRLGSGQGVEHAEYIS